MSDSLGLAIQRLRECLCDHRFHHDGTVAAGPQPHRQDVCVKCGKVKRTKINTGPVSKVTRNE